MAVSKKYAGLPDLDAAPEIYETPELTDDASTAQTGTLRTESPTPSDEGDERLDRRGLDRDEARRRFEPALVDARDVNFSDTIGGERRSYTTSRRRRRKHGNELEDVSDGEEETLARRITRLRREAEEVRLELQRRDGIIDEGEERFKDTVERQDDLKLEEDMHAGVEELNKLLNDLQANTKTRTNGSTEDELSRSLVNGPGSSVNQKEDKSTVPSGPSPSTLTSISAFADRITALEASLGVNSTDLSNQSASILPTLNSLSVQINALSSTLAPLKTSTTAVTTTTTSPLPNLDLISSRIRTLLIESEKLTASRKAAIQSLNELHEQRLRQSSISSSYSRSQQHQAASRPSSGAFAQGANQAESANVAGLQPSESSKITSQLFLEEQASKITALYQLLPSIQSSQPLLPTVLERLRTLSVIHAGAADARTGLDELERHQSEMRTEITRWKEAIEGVEKGIAELGTTMKGNVEVVGQMVKGVEDRVAKLET